MIESSNHAKEKAKIESSNMSTSSQAPSREASSSFPPKNILTQLATLLTILDLNLANQYQHTTT